MTYQTPDEWRLRHRGPQHAAPSGGSGPLRVHAHRALRLFVTAGAWGAGLCLIIGLVAMVTDAAGHSRPTSVTPAAGGYRLRQGQLDRGAPAARQGTSPAGVHAVVRTFSGTGDQTTGTFAVARHARWELKWWYSCPPSTPAGSLSILAGDPADRVSSILAGDAGGISVTASGAAGHGSTWAYSDTGAEHLVVSTRCDWTAKVVSQR